MAYCYSDEYQPPGRRRELSTFASSNTPSTTTGTEAEWEDSIRTLPLREREEHLIEYPSGKRAHQLYTRSIDRREILRRNQMMDHTAPSDTKIPNFSRFDEYNQYPENREMFQQPYSARYNAMSNQNCEATLSRSYLAARSRNYKSNHQYSMSPGIEHPRNSVFRNKRTREDTWLV